MVLKFFYDYASQPSRAVGLLMESEKIEHQKCYINIGTSQQKTDEELGKVNPNKLLPAICDDGFCLSESAAILKYLVRRYNLPDHWYPADVQSQAKVDEYLSWHSTSLRIGAAWLLGEKVFGPKFFGHAMPDPKKVKDMEALLQRSKEMLDTHFLKDSKFIAGSKISIADLQAVCEFTQFWMMHVDPTVGYPRIAQWMKDVQEALSPTFDEVHVIVYAVRDSNKLKGTLT